VILSITTLFTGAGSAIAGAASSRAIQQQVGTYSSQALQKQGAPGNRYGDEVELPPQVEQAAHSAATYVTKQ